MLEPRIIPCLLMKGAGLVKGVRFRKHRYIGDPINTIQLFNAKEADELLLLDITATSEKRIPSLELVQRMANQCLMPFTVGGGIRSVEDAAALLKNGAEKICIGTAATENLELVSRIAERFGAQSVMVSVDVKSGFWGGRRIMSHSGTRKTAWDVLDYVVALEKAGAGELLVNSIDRDGVMTGYDESLIRAVTCAVKLPVIACGGAGSYDDLQTVTTRTGCSAASGGSVFLFHGPRRAVLVNYPGRNAPSRRE